MALHHMVRGERVITSREAVYLLIALTAVVVLLIALWAFGESGPGPVYNVVHDPAFPLPF